MLGIEECGMRIGRKYPYRSSPFSELLKETNKPEVNALFYVYQQVIKSALQSMPTMQSSSQLLDIAYL